MFGVRAGLWRSESRNPAREEGHATVRASTCSVPNSPAAEPKPEALGSKRSLIFKQSRRLLGDGLRLLRRGGPA
jgi:hypothetical protein